MFGYFFQEMLLTYELCELDIITLFISDFDWTKYDSLL